MQSIEEQTFYVVLRQDSFRNDIGEMTGSALYGYVGTRLRNDLGAAETVCRELEDKGVAKVPFIDSLGLENIMEICRIDENLKEI
jgi:hypothetical protein